MLFSECHVHVIDRILVFPFHPIREGQNLPSRRQRVIFLNLIVAQVRINVRTFGIALRIRRSIIRNDSELRKVRGHDVFLTFFVRPGSVVVFYPFRYDGGRVYVENEVYFTFLS